MKFLINVICPGMVLLSFIFSAGAVWQLSQQAHRVHEVVNFTFISGEAGAMSRADILLHVVNHTTYHRGHVAEIMYQTNARPPTTDLPVFLRGVHGVPDS